jgi:hypothetical protein
VESSHAQWLYRNFTLHHYTKRHLCKHTENEIRREVELFADKLPADLPQECCHLLELPRQPSHLPSLVYNTYRVLAMKAAKTTLLRKEREYAQQGNWARRLILNGTTTYLKG